MRAVLVVGGSVAGLRVAEGIASLDPEATVTVIGDEPVRPYHRPALSKTVLAGTATPGSVEIRVRPRSDSRIAWLRGTTATDCDLAARKVSLADGGTLAWDALVIATGIRPRRLDLSGPTAGRYAVRHVADAIALRDAAAGAGRAVILGAGVLGCEIALTLASTGVAVTVVDPAPTPMFAALGPLGGARLQILHAATGVTFRTSSQVVGLTGADRADGVLLADGTHLPADVVVEAVGSTPNTDWLGSTGLDLSDGVLTGNDLLMPGRDDVAACGDIVRFPNPLFPGVLRRVEHWTMANDTARRAAASLARRADGADFRPLPYFWSEQAGLTVQGLGMRDDSDDTVVLEDGADGQLVLGHTSGGRLVAVTLLGFRAQLPRYRELLLADLTGYRCIGADDVTRLTT